MANPVISTKRVAISKANAQMVAIVAVASFVTVFSLVASQALFSQNQYQARVTTAKEQAKTQLKQNQRAVADLDGSYKRFDGKEKNVIGGNRVGSGDNDGNNAKIVLDALPSSYDFPAVTSSLEKILTSKSLKVTSITGTDDQVAQEANSSSPNPKPIAMPFTFTVGDASYTSVQDLFVTLENSIRPIQIDTLTISGGAANMAVTLNGHTYYQPGMKVMITKKVVK